MTKHITKLQEELSNTNEFTPQHKIDWLYTKREILRRKCRKSLFTFTQEAWPHIEPPSRPFVPNWHIEAICDHLEAISKGHIKRLIINIPPGHMKSLSVSVLWQAWEWGPFNMPYTRWLVVSHRGDFANRDALRARRLIASDWYQFNWGDRVSFAPDQNVKTRFQNTSNGERISSSIRGATGERADRIVADDPHNIEGAESKAERLQVLTTWNEVLTQRIADENESALVVVMQRVHQHDLCGFLIESELYEHLCLPAYFEPKRKCHTSIGFVDPRENAGELLWPERFSAERLEIARTRELFSYGFACQYQQSPIPREGGLFLRENFKIVDTFPIGMQIVRYWDLAATDPKQAGSGDPDYTVGAKVGYSRDQDMYYLLDIVRFRGTPKRVENKILATAMIDGEGVPIFIEQEGGASGKMVVEHYRSEVLRDYVCRGEKTKMSKALRAEFLSGQVENKRICLLEAEWNEEFLTEAEVFPLGSHDDQVDAVSGAINNVRNYGHTSDHTATAIALLAKLNNETVEDNSAVARGLSRDGIMGGGGKVGDGFI